MFLILFAGIPDPGPGPRRPLNYVTVARNFQNQVKRRRGAKSIATKSAAGAQTRGADPPKKRKRDEKVPKIDG